MAPKEYPRPDLAPRDERASLCAWLDYHRGVLMWKLDGLEEEQLRRELTPSGTSLLGLVKHLSYVERWWFQEVFAGQQFDYPPDHDPESELHPTLSDRVSDLFEFYRETCAESRRITARAASLDEVAQHLTRQPTLRWILEHMIEETARHNGHADILRELIDGVTGD